MVYDSLWLYHSYEIRLINRNTNRPYCAFFSAPIEIVRKHTDHSILTRTRTDASFILSFKIKEIVSGIQSCHALKLADQLIPV